MKIDGLVKLLLLVIAVSLGAIALRPYLVPPVVEAQSGGDPSYYVEPGSYMLRAPDGSRQVWGKVIIDLRTGHVWGFPTLTRDPYPSAGANSTPQTSRPFLLGTFALTDMNKPI